jgi:hypothetical protein
LADALYLVRRGVPYDVAMHLSPAQRLAFIVLMGEAEGGRFDWERMGWEGTGG